MTYHGALQGYSSERKARIRQRIWERHDGLCQICFQPVTLEEMTLDHIIPHSLGGTNRQENLQPAHEACNNDKENKSPAIPVESRELLMKLKIEMELYA